MGEPADLRGVLCQRDRFTRLDINFNPRSPCGERRVCWCCVCIVVYFNPRSPCGERPAPYCQARNHPRISIHAPLAGSDQSNAPETARPRVFQSTLPLRGATTSHQQTHQDDAISIHAPLAGSDASHGRHFCSPTDFNPRSPCGERLIGLKFDTRYSIFQSTLPLRGATQRAIHAVIQHCISIHAPLAGSDSGI